MSNKYEGLTVRNHWLHERSRLFEKYAAKMSLTIDNVEIKLDYPDAGWIDMHILVNGEEKELINLSDVYEPFEDIKEWLENIVSHVFDFTPFGVNIYDESYNYILYYEPILFQTDELLTPTPPELCGLFYIYDGCEGKIMADAVCETKAFVGNLYKKIIEFAQTTSMNDDFIDDWCWQAYNEECAKMWEENDPDIKNLFIRKVTSERVEKFLTDNNSTVRFIPIKTN